MSARGPYRRPETPREEERAPRGTVVRRAEPPEAIDADEQRLRDARYRRQTAYAQLELEGARARGGLVARGTGGALAAIGILLSVLTASNLHEGYYYQRSAMLAPAAILCGAWLLAVGTGGGVSLELSPWWVRAGAVAAFVIGLAWGASGFVGFLAAIAG